MVVGISEVPIKTVDITVEVISVVLGSSLKEESESVMLELESSPASGYMSRLSIMSLLMAFCLLFDWLNKFLWLFACSSCLPIS